MEAEAEMMSLLSSCCGRTSICPKTGVGIPGMTRQERRDHGGVRAAVRDRKLKACGQREESQTP